MRRMLLRSSPAEEAARIAMTDDGVLALLRDHFTGAESTSLCPSIPGKKELGARCAHAAHLPSDERVLMLYDDSIFGSGDEGFLVTRRRLCWMNTSGPPRTIAWADLDADGMYADRLRLVLGDDAIEISGDVAFLASCEGAFYVLALSACASAPVVAARSGIVRSPVDPPAPFLSAGPTFRPSPSSLPANATPPPSHAVPYDAYVTHADAQNGPAFACWRCSAPLSSNTPQCSFCSARPTPHGWRRMG